MKAAGRNGKPIANINVNIQGSIEVRKVGRFYVVAIHTPVVCHSKAEALLMVRRHFRRVAKLDAINVGRIEWTEAEP